MNIAEKYKVDVPPGRSGPWVVDHFQITEADSLFSFFSYRGRAPSPGWYTRLQRDKAFDPMMTDTRAEIYDHLDLFRNARGNVLLNGLGLGVALNGCLMKDEVDHLTVVELDQDIIALVGPHWKARYGNRLTIIQADALEWQPPKGIRYGAVWHDIWPAITSDNLPEMHKLHRRYGRRADWQGSWCRDWCERGY